jgi:hypothetical protein
MTFQLAPAVEALIDLLGPYDWGDAIAPPPTLTDCSPVEIDKTAVYVG